MKYLLGYKSISESLNPFLIQSLVFKFGLIKEISKKLNEFSESNYSTIKLSNENFEKFKINTIENSVNKLVKSKDITREESIKIIDFLKDYFKN